MTHIMTPGRWRVLRVGMGLPQSWLADRLGVSLRTVTRWETGVSAVPADQADALEAMWRTTGAEFEAAVAEARASGVVRVWVAGSRDAVGHDRPGRLGGEWPEGWHTVLAARVLAEVPDAEVEQVD